MNLKYLYMTIYIAAGLSTGLCLANDSFCLSQLESYDGTYIDSCMSDEAYPAFQEKMDCYENAYEDIARVCLWNSASVTQAREKKLELNRLVYNKARHFTTDEKYILARNKADASVLLNQLQHYASKIKSLKANLENICLSLEDDIRTLVESHQEKLNAHIRNLNSTTDLETLKQASHDLQSDYLAFSRDINHKKNQLALLQVRLRANERQVVQITYPKTHILKQNGITPDIGLDSKISGDAYLFLSSTDDNIYAQTQSVLGALKQKIDVVRLNTIDADIKEATKSSHEFARMNAYLNKVELIVQRFIDQDASAFYNMKFQRDSLEAAHEIMRIHNNCTSGDTPLWQKLGCNRIAHVQTNAARMTTNTAKNTMSFGSRLMKMYLPDGNETRIHQLDSLLEDNLVMEASTVYDAILKTAGD